MQILNHWTIERPNDIALICDDTQFTWKELMTLIQNIAAQFQTAGIRPNDGVMLRGKNSFELLLAYLAALECDARVLPLNPKLPRHLVDELIPRLNIAFLFDTDDLDFSIKREGAKMDFSASSRLCESPARNALLPATMTLTSASSGFPKAALHTLSAHLANAEGVVELMRLTRDDCLLLSLPMFHVSGQGVVWRWLLTGAKLKLSKRKLFDALKGCTFASLVPTQLLRLLDAETRPELKKILLGGTVIPVELVRRAEREGIECYCGYGLTEFGSTVCAKRADNLPGVGLPLKGREIKLAGEEIHLRATCMAEGYWKDGEIISFADEEGWFHTRDRGAFENNEWRVLGRLDNMFISGGENIQPEAVEKILSRFENVEQVFIVPVDDPEFGQRPVAIVEGDVAFDAMREWAKERLAKYEQPVEYFRLPEEVKTGAIKISRKRLIDWVKNTE